MSICCAPKVHHTRVFSPDFNVTSSTGGPGLRVRIKARSSCDGPPADVTQQCRVSRKLKDDGANWGKLGLQLWPSQ